MHWPVGRRVFYLSGFQWFISLVHGMGRMKEKIRRNTLWKWWHIHYNIAVRMFSDFHMVNSDDVIYTFLMHIANDYGDNNNNNTHDINNIIVKDPHISPHSIQFESLSRKWKNEEKLIRFNAAMCSQHHSLARPALVSSLHIEPRIFLEQFKVPQHDTNVTHQHIHMQKPTIYSHFNVRTPTLTHATLFFLLLVGNLICTLSNKNVATFSLALSFYELE